jgi:NAD(P)H-hydrate repair Nnr-like enzyme with NAD(P)H-hydrate dehydratase domain
VVSAVLTGEPVADALAALRTAGGRVVDAPVPADLVVDGLVGIGGRGALRPAAAALAAQVAGHDVVAVDLPSGVDADTGEVAGAVLRRRPHAGVRHLQAGAARRRRPGRRRAGRARRHRPRAELPPAPVEQLQAGRCGALPPRGHAGSDKYTRARAWASSPVADLPGRGPCCASASAAGAGAGMVRFAGAPHPAEQVRLALAGGGRHRPRGRRRRHRRPGAGVGGGPGLGTRRTRPPRRSRPVLGQDVPVLVDADALTVCARHPEWLRRRSAPTLLTPHDREFERFGEPVTADRVGSARRLAADLGVTVLLKGDATVVVGPDGPARVNGTGSPALATAGSGDVLSGGCGALLAQGLEPLDAGSVGAHLHGRAGALAARGASVPASALVGAWADAVRSAGGRRTGACHTGTP